jgi:hypothetical protein
MRELQPHAKPLQHGLESKQAVTRLGQGEHALARPQRSCLGRSFHGVLAEGTDQRRKD